MCLEELAGKRTRAFIKKSFSCRIKRGFTLVPQKVFLTLALAFIIMGYVNFFVFEVLFAMPRSNRRVPVFFDLATWRLPGQYADLTEGCSSFNGLY